MRIRHSTIAITVKVTEVIVSVLVAFLRGFNEITEYWILTFSCDNEIKSVGFSRALSITKYN